MNKKEAGLHLEHIVEMRDKYSLDIQGISNRILKSAQQGL